MSTAMNRRQFLQQMERISGGVLCSAFVLGAGGCGAARGASYLRPTVQGDRAIVPRSSVNEKSGVLVELPDEELPVYLRSLGGDRYSAVSTRCTHRGCEVEPASDRLACPCHGSEFSFTGEVLQGPAELPLPAYRVTTDPSSVYIHLEPSGTR